MSGGGGGGGGGSSSGRSEEDALTHARSRPVRSLPPLGVHAGVHLSTVASPPQSPSCRRLWNHAPPPADVVDGSDGDDEPAVWEGEVVRKEGKRRNYQSLARTDGGGAERFSVGDDVMILAPRNIPPYMARIESLIEDEGSCEGRGQGKHALLKWYYRSSDCCKEKHKTTSRREIFSSDYTDMNPVESIMKPCWILTHKMFLEHGCDAYGDVFFCREHYCPISRRFNPFEAEMAKRDFTAAIQELERRRAAAYLEPNVGTAYQCEVPEAPLRCYSPVRDREDELVFSPHMAFGPTKRSDEVSSFLARWEGVVPGRSKGLSHEMALSVLHQCMGDLSLADSKLEALHTSTSQGGPQQQQKSGGSSAQKREGQSKEAPAVRAKSTAVVSGNTSQRPPPVASGLADLARAAVSAELVPDGGYPADGGVGQRWDEHELAGTEGRGGRAKEGGDEQACTVMEADEDGGGDVMEESEQACTVADVDQGDSDRMDIAPGDNDEVQEAVADLSLGEGGSRAMGGSSDVHMDPSTSSRGRSASPLAPPSRVLRSRSPALPGAHASRDVSQRASANKDASAPLRVVQQSPAGLFVGSAQKSRTRNSAAVALAMADQTVRGNLDGEPFLQGLERSGKQKRNSKSDRPEACKKVKVSRKSGSAFAVEGSSSEACESKSKISDASAKDAASRGSGSESGDALENDPNPTGTSKAKAWQSWSEAEASSDGRRSATPPSERESVTPPVTRNAARASATPPPVTRSSSKGVPDLSESSPCLRQRSVPIDRFKPGKGATPWIKSTPPKASSKVQEQRACLESATWRGRTYKVGDFVRLASPKTKEQDYIACIVGIWQGGKEAMIKCRWFYFLDDVPHVHRSDELVMEPNEVIASSHCDLNSISSIEGPCRVLHVSEYVARPRNPQGDRNTFFFRRLYDAPAGQCHEISRDWHTQDLLTRVERSQQTSKDPAR